jgi:hypothetical protein
MRRAIALGFIWLAGAGSLLYLLLMLELQWNFFNWAPKWSAQAGAELTGVFAILVGMWFLARESRDRISLALALLACLALAIAAMLWFPAEPTSVGFLGRSQPSPLWFRAGRLGMLCVPILFWWWWIGRRFVQRGASGNSRPAVL